MAPYHNRPLWPHTTTGHYGLPPNNTGHCGPIPHQATVAPYHTRPLWPHTTRPLWPHTIRPLWPHTQQATMAPYPTGHYGPIPNRPLWPHYSDAAMLFKLFFLKIKNNLTTKANDTLDNSMRCGGYMHRR